MELPTLMRRAGTWSAQHPLWGHVGGPSPQPWLPLLQRLRASSLCLRLRSDPDGFRAPGCPFPGASPALSISSLFFGSSVERDSCVRRAPGYKGPVRVRAEAPGWRVSVGRGVHGPRGPRWDRLPVVVFPNLMPSF